MTIHRRELLKSGGALVVAFSLAPRAALAQTPAAAAAKTVAKDEVDAWLSLGRNGRVTVFTGKVDLGTGLKTAYAQMAADELDVAIDKIDMVMGDTARTPDQWLTAASTGIPVGGMELRRAAATLPSAAELRRARDYVLGQLDLSLENTENQMMWVAEQFLSYGRTLAPEEVKQRIAAVKASEIRAVAREFFRPERLSLALVSPVKNPAPLAAQLRR